MALVAIGAVALFLVRGTGHEPPAAKPKKMPVRPHPVAVAEGGSRRRGPEGATARALPPPKKPQGLPVLPDDPLRAARVAEDYDHDHEGDAAGALSLYKKVRPRLKEGRQADRIDGRMTALEKKLDVEARARFEAFSKRANEALAKEDYDGVLTVWAEAGRALSKDWRESVDQEVARAKAALAARREIDAVLAETPAGQGEERLGRLATALRAHDAVRGTPAYGRLEASAQTERARLRAIRRAAAAERAKALQGSLEEGEKRRASSFAERSELAKKSSAAHPLTGHSVAVLGEKAVVVEIGESSFKLRSSDGKAEASWHFDRDPALTEQVLELALRPESFDDLEELVIFSLKHRLFPKAKELVKRAAKLDAKRAAARFPDLAFLERASRPLLGDLKARGTFSYDFTGDDARYLLLDFSAAVKDTEWRPEKGAGLVVEGPGSAAVALRDVGFDGKLAVEVDWPKVRNADAFFEVGLDEGEGAGTRFEVYLWPEVKQAKLRRADGKEPLHDVTAQLDGGGAATVRFEIEGKKAKLSAGKTALTAEAPAFKRSRILFGEIAHAPKIATGQPFDAAQKGSATFPRVAVSGPLDRKWEHARYITYFDVLYRELSPELRLFGERAPAPASAVRGLSSDDAFGIACMGDEALAKYRAAMLALEVAERDEAADDPVSAVRRLFGALKDLDKLVRSCPYHAGALYGRARARLAVERLAASVGADLGGALGDPMEDLDSAALLDPGFAEAFALRGELRLDFGERVKAKEDLAHALELAPDLAAAYRLRGRIARGEDDLARARADFGVACGLAPGDAETRRDYLAVRQVLAGPPWEKEKTYSSETAHFKVSTNTSAARAKEVGEILERSRERYAEALGPAPEPAKKATCLVFATDEGFYNYAAFATGERDERNVGLYSRLYRQLFCFEEGRDQGGEAVRATLVHEGFHRFADETMPGCPIWLNEGLAEVFAGEAASRDGILGYRLANLKAALSKGNAPRIADLVWLPQGRFMADAPVCYAESWALCRYLLRGVPKDGDQGKAFRAFVAALRAGTHPRKALEETLLKLDAASLEEGFRRYVASLGT